MAMIPAALLACAPNVAPVTLEAVMQVESRGSPLALNVNGLRVQPAPARDAQEAAQIARSYIARGYNVDLGLMQVNNRNLAALGYTIEEVLDPCTNVKAGAAILTANYVRAVQSFGEGQGALRAALSAYNTGDFWKGYRNGYLAKYYGPGGVPALAGGIRQATFTAAIVNHAAKPTNPFTADTAVYASGVISVSIN
jgi:type IV secretion system protein VirB1